MSLTHFPCQKCGGSGFSAGSPCPECQGKGWSIPQESPGDALRDWESRNLVGLVLAFLATIVAWFWGLKAWALKDEKAPPPE